MNIGVIFGGKSCEHDISIITGIMTVNAVSVKHKAIPLYIDGSGKWFFNKSFINVSAFGDKVSGKEVHLRPSSPYLYSNLGRKLFKLDCIINCCHGRNGEDGTLSGLFELCDIPYAGSGVLASAIGMDKITQKRLYKEGGFDVTKFVSIQKHQLDDSFFDMVSSVGELRFPLMIKPSNLGSSIGISCAKDFKELFILLQDAFEWDRRVLIEEGLTDFIEVNCAVLGHGNNLLVSEIEQPLSNGFLSYEDKYMNGGKTFSRDAKQDNNIDTDTDDFKMGSGKGVTGRYIPAHISPDMAERVRETAKKAFSLLGCSGVARVDFLIKDDILYINEINTVPGSMSSYLFAFDGIEFPLLIEKLIESAFDAQKDKQKIRYTFDSDVLKNASRGSKS